jgi:molybdopterin-guanine dinucleotide biosynthesis protein A
MFSEVAGLILAGGRGTRMGSRDKCLVPVDGIPVVRRVLELLTGLFEELVLVTNNPEEYEDLRDPLHGLRQLRVTEDRFRARGPLAGIHAGLSATRRPAVFCVACDMPFLDPEMITRQVQRFLEVRETCEALVPRVGELIEPLHAVYASALAGRAERILADGEGNSVRLLLNEARTVYWDLEDSAASRSAFFNINTPKDLVPFRSGTAPGRRDKA